MTTASKLKLHTVKDLAEMAKAHGIPGWHAMRKQELIEALVKVSKRQKGSGASKSSRNGRSRKNGQVTANGKNGKAAKRSATKSAKAVAKKVEKSKAATKGSNGRSKSKRKNSDEGSTRELRELWARLREAKDLATDVDEQQPAGEDRIALIVRDSYWLQAYWEITQQSVNRARVALGQHWHIAKPVLRLWKVIHDAASSHERELVQDIEIHGRVNNWYLNVDDPPQSFQVDIGYLVPGARFFSLARSNVVTTPQTGSTQSADLNWEGVAEDYERIYALSRSDSPHEQERLREIFERRLKRPMTKPILGPVGLATDEELGELEFPFEVDAELVVSGRVAPDSRVTIKGEPVELESDGTFSVRFHLADRRHVLPIVAQTGDGLLERTIVLAVERNTKVMEPLIREVE